MKCAVTELRKTGARSGRTAASHAAHASTVIIGYGNTLRRDDGVGPAIVAWLRDAVGESHGIQFVDAHQLVPELADIVSRAERVIFIDASVALAPGRVQIRRATPDAQCEPHLGHRVSPEMILMLAQAIYGHAPTARVVAIGARSLAMGDGLTVQVESTGRRLARHLAHWLRKSSSPPRVSRRRSGDVPVRIKR